VVRLGPLDAVHESVRSLHLDNLSSQRAREDSTLASAKGSHLGRIQRFAGCIMGYQTVASLPITQLCSPVTNTAVPSLDVFVESRASMLAVHDTPSYLTADSGPLRGRHAG